MKQIYSETVVITVLFDKKTSGSFSTWCGTAKLDLTLADQTSKIQKNDVSKTKIRYRSLWGVKLSDMLRKSPGKESTPTRLRLLESMVDKLMKASSVGMVLGSYSSASDELFVKRDATTTTIISRTTGNTQDVLQFLAAATYPITIVAIDFAGLTTNKPGLVQFLRQCSNMLKLSCHLMQLL
ncbi:MAG: hypothetical protein EXX96DRAFT_506828 [Benjaminiella poitrasii]|nr:MAG: hypothetical protein EXX96DRAFT_506828 [Benjaminiella poitrasii]